MAQQLMASPLSSSPKPSPQRQAWHDWLIRLETLRYAPPIPGQAGHVKHRLATLRSELKHLHWPK
jgi:hypothetical protein